MRKIYIVIISFLVISVTVLSLWALKIQKERNTPNESINEEVAIKEEEAEETTGGVEVIEAPAARPEVTINAGTSASEYKNFEDTIDELIELTK